MEPSKKKVKNDLFFEDDNFCWCGQCD